MNGTKTPDTFCTNKIKTSRYTAWSFLPLTFLLQFTKIGNCIWLCVLILNYIPSIAINSPAVVTAVLSIIVIIGISKEGITDYIRYKSDKKINAVECIKIENGDQKHVPVKLQDVKVGDVLFLSDKQIVPADFVILGIKDADISGCGYIQTAQLDGERNLKSKLPCTQVQQ